MSEMLRGRRFAQDRITRLLVAGMLVLWLGACAASPRGAPGTAVVPADKTALFTGAPADAVMLNEGVSWLGLSDKPADYAKAGKIFAALTTEHPKSRWRPLAETFIHLIGDIESLKAKNLSALELTEALQQENERLKKDIQSLGNRLQAERAALQQENEKLKKDMELLKKLEVQLDQREKMLR